MSGAWNNLAIELEEECDNVMTVLYERIEVSRGNI